MVLLVSVLGLLVALMNLDGGLTMSAYAVQAHNLKFCFTTTDSVVTGACSQSLGACKKTQDNFVSNGYTIATPCHNVYKHIKP
jgi:hypothetical protein